MQIITILFFSGNYLWIWICRKSGEAVQKADVNIIKKGNILDFFNAYFTEVKICSLPADRSDVTFWFFNVPSAGYFEDALHLKHFNNNRCTVEVEDGPASPPVQRAHHFYPQPRL